MVIGFRISVPNLPHDFPTRVTVHERQFPLTRELFIGLRKDELNLVHRLLFQGSESPFAIRVAVFAIPTGPIRDMARPDWALDSTQLFDFNEELLVADTPRQRVMSIVAKEFGGEGGVDDEVVNDLVALMYGDPAVSVFCRLLLVKLRGLGDLVTALWVDAMERVVVQGKIHPKLVDIFWRDFALIPENRRREMEPVVWEKLGAMDGARGIGVLLSSLI
jgi:hypothetical protein